MRHDDFIEVVGLLFSIGKDLVIAFAEKVGRSHFGQRPIGFDKAHLDDRLISRWDRDFVVSSHLCAATLGDYRSLMLVNNVSVEGVFYVRSRIRATEDALVIGHVLSKEQRDFLIEIDPMKTEVGVSGLNCAEAA